jgi:hypothetical protein
VNRSPAAAVQASVVGQVAGDACGKAAIAVHCCLLRGCGSLIRVRGKLVCVCELGVRELVGY